MVDIFNLALPYFGLIFIGFACGKAKSLPESGLGWMNFSSSMHPCRRCCSDRVQESFAELNNPPFHPLIRAACAGALTAALHVHLPGA
jgi:malonate transporter and related proteins